VIPKLPFLLSLCPPSLTSPSTNPPPPPYLTTLKHTPVPENPAGPPPDDHFIPGVPPRLPCPLHASESQDGCLSSLQQVCLLCSALLTPTLCQHNTALQVLSVGNHRLMKSTLSSSDFCRLLYVDYSLPPLSSHVFSKCPHHYLSEESLHLIRSSDRRPPPRLDFIIGTYYTHSLSAALQS
jgi:hypothetical protein